MGRYVVSRVFQSLIALLLVSVVVFVLVRMTGNPVDIMLPIEATTADREHLSNALGLNRPYHEQYAIFIANALKGDLGNSLRLGGPVLDLIKERLLNSLELAASSLLVLLLIAFPLGLLAALKKGTAIDTLAGVVAALGQSVPPFWLGLMLMQVFSISLGLLPVAGKGGLASFVLPSLAMGLFGAAGVMRLLRSGMLEALNADYILFARIKGVSESLVVLKHALRNALIPVITFAAMYFAITVGMAVATEVVFAWPGIGRLAYQAVIFRDYPVIQGVVLVVVAITIAVNLVVDVLYAYINPRIRYRGS